MPENLTPKRKPPRHPLTGPFQTDTMPDRPKPEIPTERATAALKRRSKAKPRKQPR